ncbi:hypothetical protein BDA99DRAFT_588984 [Phascolomyces articulosus]|uniref:Uncharacterized protein n=1 Tax=Phascolomyces articulosus TaxID=60185 RepID=A0AAD5KA17_9FUNG|nr:hypothetical protein BDA99DRAFT_588984 [Phascolomyces articulosus]
MVGRWQFFFGMRLEKSQNAKNSAKACNWRRDWSRIIRKVPERIPTSPSSTPLNSTNPNIHFNVDNVKVKENLVLAFDNSDGNAITTSSSLIPSTSNAPMSTAPSSTNNAPPFTSTDPFTDDLSLFDQSFVIQDSTGTKRNINSILELNDDSFDTHKRRRYVLDYMVNVDRCWEPPTYWTLNNLNITQKFQQFRNRSILFADAKHNTSDNRLLSLSNIFSITPSQSTSCLHRVHGSYYKSIVKLIKCKQGLHSHCNGDGAYHYDDVTHAKDLVDQDPKLLVKKLYALIRKFGNASAAAFGEGDSDDDEDNDDNGKNYHNHTNTIGENNGSDDHSNDDDDENVDDLLLTTNILDNLVGAFQNWIDNYVFESTFIQQHLSPFMIPVFQRLSITLQLGGTHINNDPTSLLANYVGTYQTTSGDKFMFFPVKSKHLELTQMVDKLLDYGVESPGVVGVLVEGHSMKTYSMRLIEYGCYIFYEHGLLTLLQSLQDVHGALIIIEHLIQLGNILQGTLQNIDTRAITIPAR